MDYQQNRQIARKTAEMQNASSVMPLSNSNAARGGGRSSMSPQHNALDNVSVASSRPGTTSGVNAAHMRVPGRSGVRKVQSSAFGVSSAQAGPTEPTLQGMRFNENSGQLHHAPKVSNQGGSRQKSFKLSNEAYKKLTTNFNYGGKSRTNAVGSGIGQESAQANRKLQVYAT